jgi:hypothetical protein
MHKGIKTFNGCPDGYNSCYTDYNTKGGENGSKFMAFQGRPGHPEVFIQLRESKHI